MQTNTIKLATIIGGAVAVLLTQTARADDTADFKTALQTVQSDLEKLESVLAVPTGTPDLVTGGADLAGLGSFLKTIATDLPNSTQLTEDVKRFVAAANKFDTEIGTFSIGTTADGVNLITVGRNFSAPLSDIKIVITDDLKDGNTLTTDPQTLGVHLRMLARDFQTLGPGLHAAATEKLLTSGFHGTNNSWGSIFMWTGARMENPYSISVTNNTGTLKSGNKTTDGFLDFNVNLRYIFRSGDYESEYWMEKATNHQYNKFNYYYPFAVVPDLDFSLGYVFTATSAPSNYSTSTIAGGGDVSLESSMGFPLIRYKPTDNVDTNTLKWQVTFPEIGGGVVTDKNFLAAHPNLFAGAGFQLAAPARNFYWMGRLGLGVVDEPKIKSGATVVLDGLNNPVFNWKASPTLGSTLIYRITDAVAAELSANVYMTRLSSWNIAAGVSIDPTKFFQSLK